MYYTPFVRLAQNLYGRRLVQHDTKSVHTVDDRTWASSFACASCGDEFAFEADCPRCGTPVAPIEREAA
jgi:predicted RNA-binding Zn-ribbon protein involved in translation (DUF1610 family)